jgi:hypothetical protein
MTLKDALVSSSSTVGLRPVTVSAALESRDLGHPGQTDAGKREVAAFKLGLLSGASCGL